MKYVHEVCLVKWLLEKNIRHCELCNMQYVVKEEVGTAWEIFKILFKRCTRSKK